MSMIWHTTNSVEASCRQNFLSTSVMSSHKAKILYQKTQKTSWVHQLDMWNKHIRMLEILTSEEAFLVEIILIEL